MSNFLQPHGLQHATLPCPSLSPGVCSSSRALSQWWHPIISTSSPSSPPSLSLSQNKGLFQWVGSSHQLAEVLELQLQHQSFQSIFRVDFLWDWLVWSFSCSPEGCLRHHSLKVSIFQSSAFFMVQPSGLYRLLGKNVALTIQTFVGKVISLLF